MWVSLAITRGMPVYCRGNILPVFTTYLGIGELETHFKIALCNLYVTFMMEVTVNTYTYIHIQCTQECFGFFSEKHICGDPGFFIQSIPIAVLIKRLIDIRYF